jgi:hypothetical protein
MNSDKHASELTRHLETAEKAVAGIKDDRLREIAFGRVLDHLLEDKNVRLDEPDSDKVKQPSTETTPHRKRLSNKSRSGATGGIRSLVDEGKLDSPVTAAEIIALLKQAGRHYSKASVLMALLNLVRERVLTRFTEKGEKNWRYVIRR